MTVEWRSDLDKVCLEISEPGKKVSTDSPPSTIRTIFREMEDANIVDTTLNSHNIHRPEGLLRLLGSNID